MKKHLKQFESGQAIILIAVAVVGLLGTVALAVDGSMIYSDRNEMQGTADNVAMSAAAAGAIAMDDQGIYALGFSCDDQEVIDSMVVARDAAIARAAASGVSLDADISDGNGVQVSCGVERVEGYWDRYFDVNVKVTDKTKTAFTAVLFPDGISNTVEAASRIRPRRQLALGNAIASLGTDHCGGGISMTGNVDLVIYDGGIYSNYCLQITGNDSINLIVDYGSISYVSFYKNNSNSTVNPAPIQVTESIPIIDIPTPDCAALPNNAAVSLSSGTKTISSGRYPSISTSGGSVLTLNPGLYCLTGNFTVAGTSTVKVAGDRNSSDGVTFYMSGGSLTWAGTANLLLRAPSVNQPPALKGMLIFAPVTNTNTFKVTGDSNSFIRGTIYVPGAALEISGNGNPESWYTELAGDQVTLSGNLDLTIHATSTYNYTRPPMVELRK